LPSTISLKAADRVGDRHVLAVEARELLGSDEERLATGTSRNLARARDGQAIVLRQLVDAEISMMSCRSL